MSLSFGELLIKESLTKVDPELATPKGYPLKIRHFNLVRHCQQEAPLPREQPVPPHLSVSVLKVLALETMSSQFIVLIFFWGGGSRPQMEKGTPLPVYRWPLDC